MQRRPVIGSNQEMVSPGNRKKKRSRKANDVCKEVMPSSKNDDGVNGLEEKTRSVIAMGAWRK